MAMGICGVAVLMFFHCGDAVSRVSICGVAVISNPSVCDVCVFHVAVFGEMKLICGAVVSCLVFLRLKFSMLACQSLAALRVDSYKRAFPVSTSMKPIYRYQQYRRVGIH